MSNSSMYKSFEDATRSYYGADIDPLKLVPVVQDPNIAHSIAQQVDRQIGNITEAKLIKSALRAQSRARLTRGEPDLTILTEDARQHALRMVVVNAELTHSREAPQDFHEDAMRAGAYEMSNGITMAPLPTSDELRQ